MKVYLKKEDKNSMIPGIIVMIIFIAIFTGVTISILNEQTDFVHILLKYNVLLIFALIFGGFGIFFLIFLIKRPKRYLAKLVAKKLEKYKDLEITYMKFTVKGNTPDDISEYKCYTIGENDLQIGNEFVLKIKQFNWEPKYVEKQGNNFKVKETLPKKQRSLVFILVNIVFVSLLVVSILGIIMYPEYLYIYAIVDIISIVAIYKAFKGYKVYRVEDKSNSNLKL